MSVNNKRVFYVKYLAHQIYADILQARPDVRLDRLEKAELVSRVRDREDRRHVATRITAKGSQLLEEISHV